MIRAHKIILEQTNDFHWKRTMANHSRKLAQNHVATGINTWKYIELRKCSFSRMLLDLHVLQTLASL